jgi:large subunit ribosomal protein L29
VNNKKFDQEMANKKTIDTSGMSTDALASKVTELEANLSKLKFDHAVRGLQNPLEIKSTKRDIARLHTAARKNELAAASPEEVAKRSKLRLRRRLK